MQRGAVTASTEFCLKSGRWAQQRRAVHAWRGGGWVQRVAATASAGFCIGGGSGRSSAGHRRDCASGTACICCSKKWAVGAAWGREEHPLTLARCCLGLGGLWAVNIAVSPVPDRSTLKRARLLLRPPLMRPHTPAAEARACACCMHSRPVARTRVVCSLAVCIHWPASACPCHIRVQVQVERCPGVLACLLQGVSARLASPLPATRLQAMRVGKVRDPRTGEHREKTNCMHTRKYPIVHAHSCAHKVRYWAYTLAQNNTGGMQARTPMHTCTHTQTTDNRHTDTHSPLPQREHKNYYWWLRAHAHTYTLSSPPQQERAPPAGLRTHIPSRLACTPPAAGLVLLADGGACGQRLSSSSSSSIGC